MPSHSDFAPWFRDAGFVDVEERLFKIPSNAWPKNRHLKEVGKFQLINYSEGYEGIGIGLFTRILGWQPSEFQVLLARTRAELRDRAVHTYQTLWVFFSFFLFRLILFLAIAVIGGTDAASS